MRFLRLLAVALALIASPAFAQWQVPNNSVPLGKGPGKIGFGSVTGSGGAGAKCLTDTVPPTFVTCAATSGNVTYTAPGTGGTLQTLTSKLSQIINAADYGAVCDGVTNTYTAINNAIVAASTRSQAVILPPGDCLIGANTITLTTPMTILGWGVDTTYLTFSGANGINAERYRIFASNFRIISPSGTGIILGSTGLNNFFSVIENVYFRIVDVGVSCNNCSVVSIRNNIFQGIVTAVLTISAPLNPDAGDSWFSDNYVDSSNGATGVFHGAGGGWKIQRNKIVGIDRAYWMLGDFDGGASSSLLIENNSLEGCAFECIAITSGTASDTFYNVNINGNQGGGAAEFLFVEARSSTAWISVFSANSNVVRGFPSQDGFSIDGILTGLSVSNNTFGNTGTGGTGIIIGADVTNGYVCFNVITDYATLVTNGGTNVDDNTNCKNGP